VCSSDLVAMGVFLLAAGIVPPLWILCAAAQDSAAHRKFPLHPERKKTASERRAEREDGRRARDGGP